MQITKIVNNGEFGGFTDDGHAFVASFPLFIIHIAWHAGCDMEDLCDGFNLGFGSQGDWSALRDSSPEAILNMLNRACNHMELTR